jgi:Bacterial TSP3 repeat
MQGKISADWRIAVSALLSVLIVAGSFILAKDIKVPPLAQASAETALLQAIAAKDSDGDGLPDWEELLYGTDPHATDTFHLGMSDSEAVAKGLIVPKAIADVSVATSTQAAGTGINYAAAGLAAPTEGSLTDSFAKDFFTLYAQKKQANGGAELTDADISDIQNQALNSLALSVTPAADFKSASDLTVSGAGADAMKSFAAQAEAVLNKNTSEATSSELFYLQRAVQNDDAAALAHILSIARAYRDSAAGLAALPVPRELAAHDLALINAMMRMSGIVTDFARVNTDPMAAMLALQQYVPTAQSLGVAFADIASDYGNAGVALPDGASGASFVNVIRDMRARQLQTANNL